MDNILIERYRSKFIRSIVECKRATNTIEIAMHKRDAEIYREVLQDLGHVVDVVTLEIYK